VPRPVLLALLWTAPAAFALSFIKAYLLSSRCSPVAVWIALALALASGMPPLFVRSLGIRIAGGVTILLIAYCAMAMTYEGLYKPTGSGFGVILFVPVAVLVTLAQLVLALLVSVSRS
jgi:hypothetical protein